MPLWDVWVNYHNKKGWHKKPYRVIAPDRGRAKIQALKALYRHGDMPEHKSISWDARPTMGKPKKKQRKRKK